MKNGKEDEKEEFILQGGDTDICKSLLERYGKSSASHHRHLCATVAAMRSILREEDLPLTPAAYFAAVISAINGNDMTDTNAIAALSTLLCLVLPLVPPESFTPSKALEAVNVLVVIIERSADTLTTSILRSVIKSLRLLISSCDVQEWDAIKSPFKTILMFSIDKRPKVRRCAQECLEKFVKSLQNHIVIKKASKAVLSLFKSCMQSANELCLAGSADGSKIVSSKQEYLDFIHMLNTLKPLVPFLSTKTILKLLSHSCTFLDYHFPTITDHFLGILEVVIESTRVEVVVFKESENIIDSLVRLITSDEKKLGDTLLPAATLLERAFDKICLANPSLRVKKLALVFSTVAGLMNYKNSSPLIANVLKDMINHHIDKSNILTGIKSNDTALLRSPETILVESVCTSCQMMTTICDDVPKEHILAVISTLFLKLGDCSHLFIYEVIIKFPKWVVLAEHNPEKMNYLQECIGSAVIALGPERMLSLFPISLTEEKKTLTNVWLIPILKKYIVGAPLKYFLENIVPLAQYLQTECSEVSDLSISKDLWNLLPAFCNYPNDVPQSFELLTNLLIEILKEGSSMHEIIVLSLKKLVSQHQYTNGMNREINKFMDEPSASVQRNSDSEIGFACPYSKKILARNIKTLASCSLRLIEAFTAELFRSLEKHNFLKEAIGSLASITKSSELNLFFRSILKKFQQKASESSMDENEEERDLKVREISQSNMMQLASALVEGADKDLLNLIVDFVKSSLDSCENESYYTLCRIFLCHDWFYSTQCDEMTDLFLGAKPPTNPSALKDRLKCLYFLLVHRIKNSLGEVDEKSFFMLNEIIIALKNSNKDSRSIAYDVLLTISSSLKDTSSPTPYAYVHQLLNMIMGYLSGGSPQITSGAISALSLLIYKEPDLCFAVPDLLTSILGLLHSKSHEIVKAALGFMKVLVSSLQAKDLQSILTKIIDGVLPWSTVSRNHFRLKVKVIFEIVIRKCGFASVLSVTPDKYRNFIKSVIENRHSKNQEGTKGIPAKLSKMENPHFKRSGKRKHGSLEIPLDKKRSQVFPLEQKQKKRKMKEIKFVQGKDRKTDSEDKGGHNSSRSKRRPPRSDLNTKGKRQLIRKRNFKERIKENF